LLRALGPSFSIQCATSQNNQTSLNSTGNELLDTCTKTNDCFSGLCCSSVATANASFNVCLDPDLSLAYKPLNISINC
jgi:hypothetical protein